MRPAPLRGSSFTPTPTPPPPLRQLEKRMFDPDTRPRDIPITMPHASAAFKKM
jgi:hypothetical protein